MAVLTQKQVWRRPRKRRTFELTAREQINVSRSLRALHKRFGGSEALARKLGCTPDTLTKAANVSTVPGKKNPPSAGLALRLARLAQVPVEDLISGAWFKSVPCPLCGRTG